MSRRTFLTLVACVAFAVSAMAILAPGTMLAGKGAPPSAAAETMMREVGVLIATSGILGMSVRSHSDSATLRAVLIANACLQIGIFPIEIVAYGKGIFPTLGGIFPNSVFHVFAAGGFLYFANKCKPAVDAAGAPIERAVSSSPTS